MCLNFVMTQILLPKIGGGLQIALEIMVATPAIKTLIRENKVHNVDNQIQLSSKYGMQTMNQSLVNAVRNGLVREEDAEAASPDRDDFRKGLLS
jgi:twitching motility protein PilT